MFTFLSRLVAMSLLLASASVARAQEPLPPLPPPPPDATPTKPLEQGQPGVKVAEKGIIHEAFAQPGAETRGKEMTAPKAPPPPVNEVPPEIKPEGANVKWIPGYWAWDDAKNEFMWVSGFYRNVPPNREWEPGKWTEQDGKNVYLPGYWKPIMGGNLPADTPEPPKSLENGPSTPTDNPDAIWVPGGWEYKNKQFVWRAGYWASPYQTLMWQPPQYVYGGSGNYTYVPGYWDYPLEQRGLLNAPVYIDPQIAANPTFSYTPQFSVDLGSGYGNGNGWGNGGLFSSLYMGPNYNNYYYGNYGNPYGLGGLGFGMGYGDPLLGFGDYSPWWFGGPGFYNPLWNHYNWLNRNNQNWRGGGRGGAGGRGAGGTTRGGTGTTHQGTTHQGTTHQGTTHATPVHPSVGSVAGVASATAQSGTRAAALAQANQVVRPSNQVLAGQSARESALSLNSMAGGVQLNRYGMAVPGNAAGGQAVIGSGVSNYGGINSGGFGYYRGLGVESGYRSAGEYGGIYGGGYYPGVVGGYGGARYGSVGGYGVYGGVRGGAGGGIGGFGGSRGGGGGGHR